MLLSPEMFLTRFKADKHNDLFEQPGPKLFFFNGKMPNCWRDSQQNTSLDQVWAQDSAKKPCAGKAEVQAQEEVQFQAHQ